MGANTLEENQTDIPKINDSFKDGLHSLMWLVTAVVTFIIGLLISFYFLTNLEISSDLMKDGIIAITTCLVVTVVGWIIYRVASIPNKNIDKFIGLPDRNSSLNFTMLSNFLSEQAFASLLATISIKFESSIYKASLSVTGSDEVATFVSLCFSKFIFVMMIGFAVISLIRFIYPFTDNEKGNWKHLYLAITIFSVVMMFSLILAGFGLGE